MDAPRRVSSHIWFFTDADGAVIDNLTFTADEAPEPLTGMILGLGVLGLGALRRKAKAA